MKEIAVIFTCFNRKSKTEQCLKSIEKQQKKHNDIRFDIYVTDDGSTDGTRTMLRNLSTEMNITILCGNNLFWDKGMYKAMSKAIEKKHDYYLMINDDVDFYDAFFEVMMDSFCAAGQSCGISGPTQNRENAYTTYGGKLFKGKSFIDPNGTIQECNLANWNCFLVDQKVIDKIGIIDPNYDHSYGDYDYSMMMQRNGLKIYIAKEYIGTCDRNTIKGTFKDKELSRKQRIAHFFSPKGMSIKSGLRYSIKNFDYLGIKVLLMTLGADCRNLFVVLFG